MIKITDKHDCCGCTACASICGANAIKMERDEEGFFYPIVDATLCIDCKLCERVCPNIVRDNNVSAAGPQKIFAIRNKDVNTLKSSSSGGIFLPVANEILNRGGVIYGAEYDENLVVVHRAESTTDGIRKFCGSKYVQSDIRGIYQEIKSHLYAGHLVLFSGTPCQVEGLKQFLKKPYNNLITVDILCHGVPSPMIFADYVHFVRKKSLGRLSGIFMKDKTYGWGYQNLRLYYDNGTSEFNSVISNLWMKIFYDHVAQRPSCHKCRFKNIYRAGDISIGDFWGIEKSHPEFNSSLGTSLLLINTKNGAGLWENVKHQFDYLESNIEECMQPVLQCSTPEPPDKIQFWKDYHETGFCHTVQKRYRISNFKIFERQLHQFLNIIRKI